MDSTQTRAVRKLNGVLLFASWIVLVSSSSSGQEVCSLAVRVLSPAGQRLAVPISVREQDGRVEERDEEPGSGDERFCDLGILPVAVTVGSDTLCNQVTIRNVPVTAWRPYLLTVTYDPNACSRLEVAPPPIPSCLILFRVTDPTGKWVSGATLNISTRPPDTVKTDKYGRALFSARIADGNVRGSATAPGFQQQQFDATCAGSYDPRELRVELKPR